MTPILRAIAAALLGVAIALTSAVTSTFVAQAAPIEEVAYGSDPLQTLDIYPANGPAVVLVHGGGWSSGDKRDFGIRNRSEDLQSHGFAVFTINYRLATDTQDGVPEQTNDVKSAVAWVQANGADHGADVNDLNLIGGSAGAHLVSLAGQAIEAANPGTIDGIIQLSGPMDLDVDPSTLKRAQYGSISRYLGCPLEDCTTARKRGNSPLYAVSATSPRFLNINADDELTPLDQAQRTHKKLIDTRRSSDLLVVQNCGTGTTCTQHAFNLFDETEARIVAFIND